ncbi:phosphohydrolase [Piscinibacter sp.]|uniref:phosphohydrolase n=1 Tax=Piscinibacter sp. TaxID=1903157 RepID=UPI0039E719C5
MPFGPSPARAWMRLPSGARLDLITPDPCAWTDTDLAVRLSRTARWGGESVWPLPLSVAQHSLLVLELRRAAAPAPLSADDELLELLHDAEEAFLGFDCIGPLKAVLGEPFRAVGEQLMRAVARRYRLPPWTAEQHRLHKLADTAAAASEAVHCVGWTQAEVRDILKIAAPIAEADPLAARYGDRPWEPWPLDVAAQRFHAELRALCARRDAPA